MLIKKQRILIYGAGVIGSIFAGKLALNGNDITMLARGKRLNELQENGIILINAKDEQKEIIEVKTISKLNENDIYDFIIVVVQNYQIREILSDLKKNKSPNFVFVVNTAKGYDEWISVIGKEKLIVGFPSAGGERESGAVRYFIGRGIKRLFQTTTFGDLHNNKSDRLSILIRLFNDSGIPSVKSKDMDAWQKTHVAMVTSIANTLYKYNCNNYELSKHYSDVKIMVRGIKEGFRVLRKCGYKITPNKLKFYYLPTFMLTFIFKLIMNTKLAEITMAKHCITARQEMLCLQKEFDYYIIKSGLRTKAIDILKKYLRNELNI